MTWWWWSKAKTRRKTGNSSNGWGRRLEAETNLFRDVFYKGDLKMLGSKALLFVPEADLAELKTTLTDYRPFLQKFTHATNLVSLFSMINTQFRTANAEAER